MKYPINNEEKFEMLVQAFKETTKSDSKSESKPESTEGGVVPSEPTISVKSLKKTLDIREKPKESKKVKVSDSTPSLPPESMKQDPSSFNKAT